MIGPMLAKDTGHYFQGKRVLVVGLGVHGGGVATTRWLVAQGAKVRVIDTQTRAALAHSIQALRGCPVTYRFGPHADADWRWAQHIVVNPAVSPALPALRAAERRGVPVDNEASIFLRSFPGRVIAVTGTRGKTTTTTLLGKILQQHHRQTIISGNVREVAMLDYLGRSTPQTTAVLELSSFQLERLPVTNHPLHVAVLTNIKVDHLNRHGTMAKYRATKFRIFAGQTTRDWQILPWDDTSGPRASRVSQARVRWFSARLPKSLPGVTIVDGWVVEQQHGVRKRIVAVSKWHVAGRHNIDNLLAAVASARACGVALTTIRRAVSSFRGVPFRQQKIAVKLGHTFINDTAATSPDGTLAALSVFPDAFFIVGGTDKQLDVRPLAQALIQRHIPAVFLPGSATDKLVRLLRIGKYRPPLLVVQSMRSAVRVALQMAKPKQTIILSPGAASFGLFRHEFHRGEMFNAEVATL